MSDQPTNVFPPGAFESAPQHAQKTRPARRELAWNGATDVGLLLLRFGVGGTFVAHGAQKVFGIWGGTGIGGFAQVLDGYGFTQTITLAWVTGLTELVAGAFVVLGVGTPLAAAGLLAVMINVVLLDGARGFFETGPDGGVEFEAVLGLAAAALVLTGAGRIALERGRTWNRRPAAWGLLALIIGVTAALLVFVLLRR